METGQKSESPAGKPAGHLGWCEKKGIGSVFLQRGVFLVQRFLALEVGLDASVACADLLVGVHMRHLVHVVSSTASNRYGPTKAGFMPLTVMLLSNRRQ